MACASGNPPMSIANSDPENIAGSAPIKLKAGATIGVKIFPITGARHIIPTIDIASGPMVFMPSSNCAPYPKRLFKKTLSMAPQNIKATMI